MKEDLKFKQVNSYNCICIRLNSNKQVKTQEPMKEKRSILNKQTSKSQGEEEENRDQMNEFMKRH